MIYLMSDIHGQYDRYRRMLEEIDLKESDRLYVLGDAIDRGPDSFSILFDLMKRKNVELFLGNHEHMMLTYLDGTDRESWFYGPNGGQVTYRAYQRLDQDEKDRVLDYLKYHTTLVRNLEINGHRYVLSHSSTPFTEEDLFTKDYIGDLYAIQDLVWNMGPDNTYDLEEREAGERPITFISGHIVSQRFTYKDEIYTKVCDNGYTWIDIDCGCAMGKGRGALACLSIDGNGQIGEVRYVK